MQTDIRDFTERFQSFVLKNVSANFKSGVKGIYVVGSYSSDEMTVLRDPYSGEVSMSDIDIVVDVQAASYLSYIPTNIANKLSVALTKYVTATGVKTHVSISVTSFELFNLFRFIKQQNTVYLYELTPINSIQKGCTPFINTKYLSVSPTKLDSLNLVFSSIADYIFSTFDSVKNINISERTYILAKRSLTLVYSLMLFNGIYPRTYQMRTYLARRHFANLDKVLSEHDLEVLDALVKYKIDGNWRLLAEELRVNPMSAESLMCNLDSYFKELATKVLTYELSRYVHENQTNSLITYSDSLPVLLEKYKSKMKVSFRKRPFVALQYLLSFFTGKNSEKLKLALNSVLVKKLRIDDLLRINVSLVFLSLVAGRQPEIEHVLETKRFWYMFLM